MRRTILILSALALTSGAAVADRYHGGGGGHVAAAPHAVHNGGARVYNGGSARVYNGGSRVVDHRVYNNTRVYNGGYNRGYVGHGYREYRPGARWDRGYYRNYYWDHGYYRPYVGVHYYNYYSRPALIVEDFAPMAGYYWVRGSWQWDGAEWMWYPGHYAAY